MCAAPSASRDLRRWDCETRDARSENGTRMVTVQVTRAGKTCGARRSDGASGTGARARDATWRCELLRCRPGLRHTSHGRVQANTWISCMAHMPAITPQTPARQVSAHAGLMRVRTTSVRVYVRARTLRKLELRRLRISQGKARGRGFPPRRHVCMRVRALRLRLRLCRATLALATGSSHPPSATPSHIQSQRRTGFVVNTRTTRTVTDTSHVPVVTSLNFTALFAGPRPSNSRLSLPLALRRTHERPQHTPPRQRAGHRRRRTPAM